VGGASDRPLYALVAQADIKSYEDLRGKRVGVFSETSMSGTWLQLMLKAKGLNKGDYDLIPVGGTSAIFAALQSKGIAAGMLTQPQDLQALRLGFKSLGLSTDVVKEIAWASYSTSRDFASKNEEVLVRFLNVQRKGSIWVNDPKNRTEAIAILVKYTKAPQADAEATYDLWMTNKALTADSAESPGAIKSMIDMMVLTGQLKEPIAVDKVFDPKYMEKAKARG
jgi:NitT/TauT family transport system substrate-binding protein